MPYADGPKSLDLESQFAAGMLGSRASLQSNGELSPVVHLATANGGSPPVATANGHVHSNGGPDLRRPPSYAADGGRASPAPSLPPPLPPANPFAGQALSPVMTSSAITDQQQRQGNAFAESAQLEGSRSAPMDLLKEQSSSALREDGTMSWPEPNAAFQVSRHVRAGSIVNCDCMSHQVMSAHGASCDMPRATVTACQQHCKAQASHTDSRHTRVACSYVCCEHDSEFIFVRIVY